MIKPKIKTLEQLDIVLNSDKTEIFDKYARIFLEKNSRLNLISKNDEKFLFEKHIFDSLAINKFLGGKCNLTSFPKRQSLLDIGTGGGFPSIPLAILYENLDVYPLDSIRKKIKAIEEINAELGLKNLFPLCERAEKLKDKKFDYITTRAVAPVKVIVGYSVPNLKKGGYFIAYKSKKATDEIKEAQAAIKKSGLKLIDIIEYKLPLEEEHERNLIIFQKRQS